MPTVEGNKVQKRKVSPFEYAITRYIHENIAPMPEMESIEPKTPAEVTAEREDNIRRQLKRIRVKRG